MTRHLKSRIFTYGLFESHECVFCFVNVVEQRIFIAIVVFPFLYGMIVCPYTDNIPLHYRCRKFLVYGINVREIEIKTCRLSCDKAVELD